MSAILRDLGEGPDSPAKAMARDAWRQGWVKKRPTSHKDKPFKQSAVVKRFFDTHGFQVAYYDRAPIGKNSGVRPKGWFDLREVTLLRPCADPSAPPATVDLHVGKHAFTIDFGYGGEMNMWLAIWSNAVPRAVLADKFADEFLDATMANELKKLGPPSIQKTWLRYGERKPSSSIMSGYTPPDAVAGESVIDAPRDSELTASTSSTTGGRGRADTADEPPMLGGGGPGDAIPETVAEAAEEEEAAPAPVAGLSPELEAERRAAAATKVQSMMRRKKAVETTKGKRAAAKLAAAEAEKAAAAAAEARAAAEREAQELAEMESAVKLQSTFRGKKGRDLAKELEEKKAAVAAKKKEAEQLESTARRLSAAAEDLDSQAAAAAAEEEAAVAAEAAAAAAAAEVEERAKAATKLQARFRGKKGREAAATKAEEKHAAAKAAAEQSKAKLEKTTSELDDLEAELAALEADGEDGEGASPRKSFGDSVMGSMKELLRRPSRAGKVDASASKVQSMYRGKQGRAAAGEARAAAEEEKAQAQAAAILQSGYRGKMSRAEVAKRKAELRAEIAKKKEEAAAAALELEKNEAAETAANLVVGAEQQRVLAAEAPPAFIQSLCKCLCEFQGTVSPKSLEEAKVAEEEGRKEMDGKHYKEALQNFVHAHAMVPTKPLYLLLAANAHRVLGHDEAARTLYDFVLTSPELSPDEKAEAENNLAEVTPNEINTATV